jgi:hypothetical protein
MDQNTIDRLTSEAGADKAAVAAIPELAGQYRRLAVVQTAAGAAIFRNPKKTEWQRYMDTIFDEKKRARAVEQLARDLVVHPSKQEFSDWIDDFPGLTLDCADPLTTLAKGEAKEHAGK